METAAERTEKEDISMVNETAMSMCTTHPEWDGMGCQQIYPMLVTYLPSELCFPPSAQADGGHLLVHGIEQTRSSCGGEEGIRERLEEVRK